MIKKSIAYTSLIVINLLFLANITATKAIAATIEEENPEETIISEETAQNYLKAVIGKEETVEIQKSTIFDASQSFIPNPESEIKYEWDFGDGNKNEGIEVLHAYKEPGEYTITLEIINGENKSKANMTIFAYRKLIVLISDQTESKDRIDIIQEFAKKDGVFIKLIESFGSSTEFISEEILSKKLTEEVNTLQKTEQIMIWTKENAGLNAISRYIQNNQKKETLNLSQKSIIVLEKDISTNISRIEQQFNLIRPKSIIVTKEGAINPLIESSNNEDFITVLEKGGYEYETITENTGKIRPWNFMSYFVNILINKGIPDNTIALLLLLPVIATVVAFMKQVVGISTFGIYTPSTMTLSFLVIGLYAGLLTLITAIIAGVIVRPILTKVRMLFIPKMAIVMTLVSIALLGILIISIYLNLFDAQFLSIAIFPMLILSTLVEKMVSVKSDKGLSSALLVMSETVLVAVIAYFIAGGEINLGFASIQLEIIKRLMINYPEIILLLLGINFLLGKWTGLRVIERIRFREVLRHIEE